MTADPAGAPAPDPDDADAAPSAAEVERELAQLRRAERIILLIRWAVMAAWLPIFATAPLSNRPVVYLVHAVVALYTLASTAFVLRSSSIRTVAVATMLGDAAAVFAMCSVTGGIASDVYPYFYLHLLTTAIRFGMRETLAALALDVAFSLVLAASAADTAAAPLRALSLRLFYLVFVAVIAGLLSRDAKTYYRRALREGDRRRELLWRLLHAEDEERKRIAGEIHDRMGQRFFSFQYAIDRAGRELATELPQAAETMRRLGEQARALSDETRAVMNELRTPVLDDFGFVEAVREHVAALPQREGPAVTLSIADDAPALPAVTAAALFRIFQEAVLNVRKHANASRLMIAFARDGESRALLRIRDDGCGFDAGRTPRGHLGFSSMRERAEACGGSLEVRTAPGAGTEIRVAVPVR